MTIGVRPATARKDSAWIGVVLVVVVGTAIVLLRRTSPQIHSVLGYAGLSVLGLLLLLKLFLVARYAVAQHDIARTHNDGEIGRRKFRGSLAVALLFNFAALTSLSGGFLMAANWTATRSVTAGVTAVLLIVFAVPLLLIGLRYSGAAAVWISRQVRRGSGPHP